MNQLDLHWFSSKTFRHFDKGLHEMMSCQVFRNGKKKHFAPVANGSELVVCTVSYIYITLFKMGQKIYFKPVNSQKVDPK